MSDMQETVTSFPEICKQEIQTLHFLYGSLVYVLIQFIVSSFNKYLNCYLSVVYQVRLVLKCKFMCHSGYL
jgi:hypothetical protein